MMLTLPVVAACGSSVDPDIRFTRSSISLNPVPAPTATQPVSLRIAATVDFDPQVGSVGIAFGQAIPAFQGTQIVTPVAGFRFPCTQAGTGSNCKASNYTLNCTVSLAAGAPATRRSMACDDGQAAVEFDAGDYDYQFSANTPGGEFFGTDYDYVRGRIRFD
jgi:hypothetical protein